MNLTKLIESNHPYFIQNKDKTVDIAIDNLDCLSIYIKQKELQMFPE